MNLKTLVYMSLITLVASLSPTSLAQTFSVIQTFSGGLDGANPESGVILKADALYGTTTYGGLFEYHTGTAYQITHQDSNWVKTPLSYFQPIPGGYQPQGGVSFGSDGRLYGTAGGGVENHGVVFTLTPPASICENANCQNLWAEDLVYSFGQRFDPADGQFSDAELAWDQQGNIYGTTVGGGRFGFGTVFQMTKSENGWIEAPIYSFVGRDGESPRCQILVDKNGNLFGVTQTGGFYRYGNVFELKYVAGIGWEEITLHHFQDNYYDGMYPVAGLLLDGAGNLYGATTQGGEGAGTVFELSPSGDTWTFQVIYNLYGPYYYSDCGPQKPLTMDSSGNIYGTTKCGGANGLGSIFELTNTRNGWGYRSLHEFTGGADGAQAVSQVTIGAGGTLYGTTSAGGDDSCEAPYGCGVVWTIKP